MADCSLLSIGRELLLGVTVDTNAAYLATEISALGFSIKQCRICDDDLASIVLNIRELAAQSDLLIITGGLGPTPDDLTRQGIADACGTELIFSQELMDNINQRLGSMNIIPSDSNANQAYYPASGGFLRNPQGTAPGISCKCGDCQIYATPGVPFEMKNMFAVSIKPLILDMADGQRRYMKRLNLCGIGESRVGEAIAEASALFENCEIGTTVDLGIINLRVMAHALTEEAAEKVCLPAIAFFQEKLGNFIFGEDNTTLQQALLQELKKSGKTLSLAESCTGGMIASSLVSIPGASDVLLESVVTYSNASKEKRLGVSPQTLMDYGAVSEQTALEMACGVRKTLDTDFALAVTGIAGPGGGTPEKPCGMVWLAVASKNSSAVIRYNFPHPREQFRRCVCVYALNLLRRFAENLELPKGTKICQ